MQIRTIYVSAAPMEPPPRSDTVAFVYMQAVSMPEITDVHSHVHVDMHLFADGLWIICHSEQIMCDCVAMLTSCCCMQQEAV